VALPSTCGASGYEKRGDLISIENVRADLARYGLADCIREFDTSSATVAEAAVGHATGGV